MQEALEQARLARIKQQKDDKEKDVDGKVQPVHSAWLLAAKAAMMNQGGQGKDQGQGKGQDHANMAVFKPSPPSRPLPTPQRPWDPSGGGIPSNQPPNNQPTNQNNQLAADVKGAGVGAGAGVGVVAGARVRTPPRLGGIRVDIDATPLEPKDNINSEKSNHNNNNNAEHDRRAQTNLARFEREHRERQEKVKAAHEHRKAVALRRMASAAELMKGQGQGYHGGRGPGGAVNGGGIVAGKVNSGKDKAPVRLTPPPSAKIAPPVKVGGWMAAGAAVAVAAGGNGNVIVPEAKGSNKGAGVEKKRMPAVAPTIEIPSYDDEDDDDDDVEEVEEDEEETSTKHAANPPEVIAFPGPKLSIIPPASSSTSTTPSASSPRRMLQWVSDLETQMDALKDQVKKIQTNSGDGSTHGLVGAAVVTVPTVVAPASGLASAPAPGLVEGEGLVVLPLELPPAPSIAVENNKDVMNDDPYDKMPPRPPSPVAKKVLKIIDQIRKIYGATPFIAGSPVLAAAGGQGLVGGIQGRQMKVWKTPPSAAVVGVVKTPDLLVRKEVRERHRNDFQQFVKNKRHEHGNTTIFHSFTSNTTSIWP